ncbi:MAG: histidine--tRNA ligase [Bacteroidales bacterium]|jgi:histidyl-tRNA synthetase|nr:histidine--tRNA ligase [Bacteroidales bacterium]MCI2121463.1 histidine--tRNA ligase [Bacteroidales bacterium]MCI2145260.1 histidine--tRNA ligase [Bacteroidales bacterium]
MSQKPSIPAGTRDFSPKETAGRNYIFDTVKSVFRNYGYQPIETPAMENLSTLLGKYGDEGDKLLFKILNSGDSFAGVDRELPSNSLAMKVCEKGLRYDLTVPLARYVVQHRNEIVFPFKRYQIQPVWRADRPQKGRYREFYQCDVDVIGTDSMLNELELAEIVDDVFGRLGIRVCIRINNRKILAGLAETCGFPEKLTDITVAIDKLEKIGLEEVENELRTDGLTDKAIAVIEPVLELEGGNNEKISAMRKVLSKSEIGAQGLDELSEVLSLISHAGISQSVVADFSLARGLNYYTGAIFEVKALDYEIGSICGGGRYDNLTGIFGLPGVSGVGISFGADRIYDVLKNLDKFPREAMRGTVMLFANMGSAEAAGSIPATRALRSAGISCEMYPDKRKLGKQFEYADKLGIRFVAVIGDEELKSSAVTIKDLSDGSQTKIPINEIVEFIRKKI